MMNRIRLSMLFGVVVMIGAGCQQEVVANLEEADLLSQSFAYEEQQNMYSHPGVLSDDRIKNKQVRISTEKGDVVFTLFDETAPLTVSNFVYLVEEGFYNGVIFHRVVEDFVVQGGDPTGSGHGGPGYRFEDELGPNHIPQDLLDRMDADDEKALYQRGIVAMANAGPNTNGSQFFFMLENIPSANMPNLYSIFGEVTEGMDVIDQIEIGDVMTSVTIEDRIQE